MLLGDDGAGSIGIETGRRKAYAAAVTGVLATAFTQFATSPAMAAAPVHLVDPTLLPAPGGASGATDTDDCLAATAVKTITDLLLA